MSEENKQEETEGEEQETPKEDTDTGSKPEDANLIDRADSIAKRIEEGNKRFGELVSRQEAAIAKQMLGGHAPAGQPIKSKEELEEQEIDKLVKESVDEFYGHTP